MTVPLLISILIAAISCLILYKYFLKQRQLLNNQKQLLQELTYKLEQAQTEASFAQDETRTKNELERLAGQIITKFDQGVICIDANNKIRVVNRQAEKYLQEPNAIGKPYKDILKNLKINGKNDFSQFEETLKGKKQTLPENTTFSIKQNTIPVSAILIPLSFDGLYGIALIFTDNSQNVNLISEEKTFFSVAVHELRTPLTAIRLAANLLQNKYDKLNKTDIKDKINKIEVTALHSIELVNDFLNLSRIEQGRLEVNKTPFDIVSLTQEVIKELMDLAKERSLYIDHKLDVLTGNRKVLGDKIKAKEVLTNLLSNAIKYTIQGGLTITHEEKQGLIKTRVIDTGAGIPPGTAVLLFKRFGQTHAGRLQSPQKSTGLGLYISKKIARLMGGDVILEDSKPGKGSTFTFSLPVD